MPPHRLRLIILGFACGFAFDYWWWESWLPALILANWIALTWQVGDARLDQERGRPVIGDS